MQTKVQVGNCSRSQPLARDLEGWEYGPRGSWEQQARQFSTSINTRKKGSRKTKNQLTSRQTAVFFFQEAEVSTQEERRYLASRVLRPTQMKTAKEMSIDQPSPTSDESFVGYSNEKTIRMEQINTDRGFPQGDIWRLSVPDKQLHTGTTEKRYVKTGPAAYLREGYHIEKPKRAAGCAGNCVVRDHWEWF